nr:lipoyl synthase [uncultured Desulfobulbus sp.]
MKRPNWLVLPAPNAESMDQIQALLDKGRLHSVCESAQCPNIGECFANKTCTFMILGDICTRNCTFCAVSHGRPLPPDPAEPEMVALTAQQLRLKHVVVTSVTRDDLPDGGAAHFAATIKAIQDTTKATIEVLIPDFRGEEASLQRVIAAQPNVINHNLETVPRIYRDVRPGAGYHQSLELIARVAAQRSQGTISTKSGLMLGLGETKEEILEVMDDLLNAGCQILTLGQYLRPSPEHHQLVEYIHPDVFEELAQIGEARGFSQVVAGPLVRSSYHAAESYAAVRG